MKTGKDLRGYVDLIISDIDEGRLPRRRAPKWIRNLALPVAVGLSFGLGGCMVEAPAPEEGLGAADLGRADGFGDDESCPGPAEVCDDSRDNDLDGFTDCYDFDCLGSDACSSMVLYAAPMEQDCANDTDDDGDGDTDCADFDCSRNCLCEAVEPGDQVYPILPPGSGEAQCADAADCESCLEIDGCGWCSTVEACVPGYDLGPLDDECSWQDFDYYDC